MTDLKMLTQDEVSELINVSRDQITMLREVGIIRATKTGKCYMFSQADIKRFQRDYVGLDLSNIVKAFEAFNLVEEQKKATAPTVTTKATRQNYFQ